MHVIGAALHGNRQGLVTRSIAISVQNLLARGMRRYCFRHICIFMADFRDTGNIARATCMFALFPPVTVCI